MVYWANVKNNYNKKNYSAYLKKIRSDPTRKRVIKYDTIYRQRKGLTNNGGFESSE